MTRYKKRKIIIFVCIVLISALIGVGIWQLIVHINIDPIYKKISKFPIVYNVSDASDNEIEITDDLAYIPRWDTLSIIEQYSGVDLDGIRYTSRKTKISADMLLDKIGNYTANGTDMINDVKYTKNAEVYSVKNISSECAVAVKLEGMEEYYVYVNPYYHPETLGEFIDDLNLKEQLSFGTVTYNYSEIKGNTYIDERVEFTTVDDEVIWQKLLGDTKLKNIKSDDIHYGGATINISVNVDLLGYENIGIWITNDGYMHTNILDSAKVFNIGKEKVTEVTDYLLDNCDGKRYVYTQESANDDYVESSEYEETASFVVKSAE